MKLPGPKLQESLSLECPYCRTTNGQFKPIAQAYPCKVKQLYDNVQIFHRAYRRIHCEGNVVTEWGSEWYQNSYGHKSYCPSKFLIYYPTAGEWKPKVNLAYIKNNEVKEDFEQAIDCYNHGFYNASMIMSRRAIQQEMISRKAEGGKLYEQIESMGISERLKTLLHKVRNFGNHGAHPDFCLFDKDGQKIDDKKGFAKLSLEFLDKYFLDQYETDTLIEKAPKSKKELKSLRKTKKN